MDQRGDATCERLLQYHRLQRVGQAPASGKRGQAANEGAADDSVSDAADAGSEHSSSHEESSMEHPVPWVPKTHVDRDRLFAGRSVHLIVYGRNTFGDLPEILLNLPRTRRYLVLDCRRLYRDPDRRHHHLHRADGNNNKLVRELTKHMKFASLVYHAKSLMTPVFRNWESWTGDILIGVRCNGGRQRSVGSARILEYFMKERGARVTRCYMNQRDFCGCSECHGQTDDIFLEAVCAFRRLWGA